MKLSELKVCEIEFQEEPVVGEITVSELSDSHLEHHGILGMKWGVRRYQNKDGSLTAEGKAKRAKQYDSGSNKWKGKEARHLSDEELNRRNSRLQREKQYKDLTEAPIKKETRQALKKILVLSAVGAGAAVVGANYKALVTAGDKWLKHAGKQFLTPIIGTNAANVITSIFNAKK